jgi:ribonuclease PH
MQRSNNRNYNELRPLKVVYDIYSNAAGSILFEMGNTKVLCSVTIQSGVPHFLRGKGAGWLTAEYSMLPASTPIRTIREATSNKRSGRTIEISRLIGRTLRAISHLPTIGEYTIFVDCDVLQADGSTRTACVTGAYLALKAAQERWLASGFIKTPLVQEELAAVSVGVTAQGQLLLDIDYAEDSAIGVDFNYVLTRSGKIIEVQGAAEAGPISWQVYEELRLLAIGGVNQLYRFFDENSYVLPVERVPEKLYKPLLFMMREE